MTPLNDIAIKRMAIHYDMIYPFVDHQVREVDAEKVVSYGLSSFGYDFRLGKNMIVPSDDITRVRNVKRPNREGRKAIVVEKSYDIPPHGFILAETLEHWKIPDNIIAIVYGKSTWAREGLLVNVTPMEPCFSDDTEIMTPNGWVLLRDIQVGDLVMGIDNDGKSIWQPVEKKQEHEYDGVMHRYDGKSIDLLVTPNHKLFVQRRTNGRVNRKSSEFTLWETSESNDVFGHHNFKMSRKLNWVGRTPEQSVTIGDMTYPTKPFLTFLGLWLGDGSAYIADHGNYVIKLAALKDRKRIFFRDILDQLGFNYLEEERGFRFQNKALVEYLLPYRHAKNKHVPREWMDLSPEYLEYLWLGLLNSDGNQETGTYTTTSKQLADDVQYIAHLMGKAAIVRLDVMKDTIIDGSPVSGGGIVYKVRVVNNQLTPKITPDTHSREYYCGQVFDVTVPNHLIFVRRNGKAVWSGNCWEGVLTIEISNTTNDFVTVYVGEGIGQAVFFRGDRPQITYADRRGKYQNQTGVTEAKL